MSDALSNPGRCEFYTTGHAIPSSPQCGQSAMLRYPAMGGGYMRLCAKHGVGHEWYCERWTGAEWVRPSNLPEGWRRAYDSAELATHREAR
jgi:hypothetical protein